MDYLWTTGGQLGVSFEGKLGSGGYSEVYKMKRVVEGQYEIFARKLIRPFAQYSNTEVRNEIRAIQRLYSSGGSSENRRNLVKLVAHGSLLASPYYYIDMEFCPWTLEDFIKYDCPPEFISGKKNPRYQGGEISRRSFVHVFDIMHQICRGLAYIHSLSEVHRDLKPKNVLYSTEDPEYPWKIADFGLTSEGTSKRVKDTVYGRGTACYRAPEIVREEAGYNNKVDVFALGCLFYELLTRKKAFANDYGVREYAASATTASIITESDVQQANLFQPLRGFQLTPKVTTLLGLLLSTESTRRPRAEKLQECFKGNFVVAMAAEFHTQGNSGQELVAWYNALLSYPGEPYVKHMIGNSERKSGNVKRAIELYQEAWSAIQKKNQPDNESEVCLSLPLVGIYPWHGTDVGRELAETLRDERKDLFGALEVYQQVYKIKRSAEIAVEMARMHQEMGADAEAVRLYEKAHELEPDDTQITRNLASARARTRSHDPPPLSTRNPPPPRNPLPPSANDPEASSPFKEYLRDKGYDTSWMVRDETLDERERGFWSLIDQINGKK